MQTVQTWDEVTYIIQSVDKRRDGGRVTDSGGLVKKKGGFCRVSFDIFSWAWIRQLFSFFAPSTRQRVVTESELFRVIARVFASSSDLSQKKKFGSADLDLVCCQLCVPFEIQGRLAMILRQAGFPIKTEQATTDKQEPPISCRLLIPLARFNVSYRPRPPGCHHCS